MVMVELGVAPSLAVDANGFADMVARKQIAKLSVTTRQVVPHLDGL
jgi:A-macroglobulin receptor